MSRPEADAPVRRLESALVPRRPAYLVRAAAGFGVAVMVLLLVFMVTRLMA